MLLIDPSARVITLTNSSRSTFDTCRYKFYLAYLHKGVGIAPFTTKPPLRFGTAVHAALGQYYSGADIDVMVGAGLKHYRDLVDDPNVTLMPNDAAEFEKEKAKVEGMLRAYAERYDPATNDSFEVVGTELVITHTLGHIGITEYPGFHNSWRVDIAGKLDVLGKDADGYFVMDHKTMAAFREAFYDKCLFDFQTTLYCILAMSFLKEPINRVIYNCMRKSALRGSSGESPAQLMTRIKADYLERIETYFNRITAIRTASQIGEGLTAVEEVAADAINGYLFQRFRKNMSSCDIYSGCPFRTICASGQIDEINFRLKTSAHEELDDDGSGDW